MFHLHHRMELAAELLLSLFAEFWHQLVGPLFYSTFQLQILMS